MLPIYLVTAALLYFLLDHVLGIKKDIREPPFVPLKIPWIGHLVGILRRKKTSYFVTLSKRISYPIYTRATPRSRSYIATKPEVASDIQKNSRTLQLGLFMAPFVARMCGISKEGTAILTGVCDDDDQDTFFNKLVKPIHVGLASGEQLDTAHQATVRYMQVALDRLPPVFSEPARLKLLNWLQYEIAIASCRAVWGSENPIDGPELIDAFYTFKDSISLLALGILPSIVARKGYLARCTLANAFAQYYRTGGHEQASQLIKDGYGIARAQGLSLDDTASLTVSTLLAVVVNTVPNAFWAVYHIFSSPQLLAECRTELATAVRETGLRPAPAAQTCPLLQSAVKETIRMHSCGATTRFVMQDTPILDHKFLLKKGGLVQIPAEVIHADTEVWGPDATEFNPYRFQKHASGLKADGGRVSGDAFRAFGAGSTICPGRHLALREIGSLVAMLVADFEIEPVSGRWEVETGKVDDVSDNTRAPADDVEVFVRRMA